MTSNAHALSQSSQALTDSHSAAHGLGAFLKGQWDAYLARRAKRATVFLLRSLDDRNLHDIGLDRSEIESVVYGKPSERQLRYERR